MIFRNIIQDRVGLKMMRVIGRYVNIMLRSVIFLEYF